MLIAVPVHNALNRVQSCILSISLYAEHHNLLVYNDHSNKETLRWLELNLPENSILIHAPDGIQSPSYANFLRQAKKYAMSNQEDLLIIESDVEVNENAIHELQNTVQCFPEAGMIGALTVNTHGMPEFPCHRIPKHFFGVLKRKNLSFCCTVIPHIVLVELDFTGLPTDRWLDLWVSKKVRKLKRELYLNCSAKVLHFPHSSRPWKKLKKIAPFHYYFLKWFKGEFKNVPD